MERDRRRSSAEGGEEPESRRSLTQEMVFMRTKCNRMDLIRNLNLWGNDLQNIGILRHMPNLEVLSLSVNAVSSLAALAGCHKLVELYLRKNDIRDLAEVHHLAGLRQLRVLWLNDNPCAALPHYRQYVLHHLPHLAKLDSQDVTEEERRRANDVNFDDVATCLGMPAAAYEPVPQPWEDFSSRPHDGYGMYKHPQEESPGSRHDGYGLYSARGAFRREPGTPIVQQRAERSPAQTSYDDGSPEMHPQYEQGERPPQYPPPHAGDGRGWQERPPERPQHAWAVEGSPPRSRRSTHMDDDPPGAFLEGPERGGDRGAARADNILCAVLALTKELDQQGLELVRRAIEQRLCEL